MVPTFDAVLLFDMVHRGLWLSLRTDLGDLSQPCQKEDYLYFTDEPTEKVSLDQVIRRNHCERVSPTPS